MGCPLEGEKTRAGNGLMETTTPHINAEGGMGHNARRVPLRTC